MCVKSALRLLCAAFGIVGTLGFLVLSIGFYLPFTWYLNTGAQEWIGGLYLYCVRGVSLDSYDCDTVDEDVA